jgi:hypothetical protein
MITLLYRNKAAFKPIFQLGKTKPMVQPELTINEPDDIFEQVADAMADTVVRMPERNFIQRKCSHCWEEMHMKFFKRNFNP